MTNNESNGISTRKIKQNGTYLVISDIQGSFDYLDRFFDATKNMKKEGVICLGDIVNRFEDYTDNRCIDLVRNNVDFCVKGNHEDKQPHNIKEKISSENLEYIANLSDIEVLDNILLFHSSLREDGLRLKNITQIEKEAEYIKQNFPQTKFAFFGHSHEKGAYVTENNSIKKLEDDEIHLNQKELNLINPGGIGLWHDLQKTFARIDFDNGRLNFFTLEQAEDMSYKNDVVNSFDNRWMPELNISSYHWFKVYARNDAPFLIKEREQDPLFGKLGEQLNSFNMKLLNNKKNTKKQDYLEKYSLELAQTINSIRKHVVDFYDTKDPFQSRNEYLELWQSKS